MKFTLLFLVSAMSSGLVAAKPQDHFTQEHFGVFATEETSSSISSEELTTTTEFGTFEDSTTNSFEETTHASNEFTDSTENETTTTESIFIWPDFPTFASEVDLDPEETAEAFTSTETTNFPTTTSFEDVGETEMTEGEKILAMKLHQKTQFFTSLGTTTEESSSTEIETDPTDSITESTTEFLTETTTEVITGETTNSSDDTSCNEESEEISSEVEILESSAFDVLPEEVELSLNLKISHDTLIKMFKQEKVEISLTI